ncbi:MAG: diguanylate cyclase [Legionella sp.]|nr:diguanylate cyclase [Legionella sp.]
MKILVADDSITNIQLITSSLQQLGHEVLAASSGQEAIDLFEKYPPDLVILDVVMEGMNGFECAKKMRSLHTEDWIPIIFLSGSADDDSIAQGIDAGGDDYLTKPFSEISLAAKIKAMQRISSMRQELYEATKKLAHLSSVDALTGTYNRLQFNKTIQEKIAEALRQNGVFALLFLDLDKFKAINDTYGHPAGDKVLIQVTQRLQSCLRTNDFLARMGGDEFAIILSPVEETLAGHVSQKIIDVLSPPYKFDNHEAHCTSSIGIVMYPRDGRDQASLTKNADIAMYYAKNTGRNNYQYFNLITQENQDETTLTMSLSPLNTIDVLSCIINEVAICIPLKYIIKNIPLPRLERLPHGPYYVVGLMNWLGQSIPIIDLGARLKLVRNEPYSLNTPILLCTFNNIIAGLLVDKIFEITNIQSHALQRRHKHEAKEDLLGSVIIDSKLTLLINTESLLSNLDLQENG